jgi:hypothetical protein
MAKKVKATVLLNTENKYKIILSVQGIVQNHTLITAAELRTSEGVTLADSEIDASDWDFTNTGFLLVKLGLTDLPVGTHSCRLIIKDSTHTIGLAWDTEILLTVLP